MTCSRCSAEAVVKRDAAYYCGKCAMARDWEEIISIVQSDAASAAVVDFGAVEPVSAVAAQPEPEVEVIKAEPEPLAATPEPVAEQAPTPDEAEEPMVAAAATGSDLPADPFA